MSFRYSNYRERLILIDEFFGLCSLYDLAMAMTSVHAVVARTYRHVFCSPKCMYADYVYMRVFKQRPAK